MEIVDAQLHEPAPWLDWRTLGERTRRHVLTETLLTSIDAVGVDAAILFPIEDYLWAEEICVQHPHRFAWVPMMTGGGGLAEDGNVIHPDAPDLEERIAHVRSRTGVVAIRIVATFWPEDVARAQAGGFERAFTACEQQRIPVFLRAAGHLDLVAPIAEAHAQLTLIIDHIGLPQPPAAPPDTPPFKKLPELLALARHPNVAVKLCGVEGLSEQMYPFADVWPRVREIVDAFGPERLMWASDISRFRGRVGWKTRWPGSEAHYPSKHTYAEAVMLYRDNDLLSDDAKALILGKSARRLLNWAAAAAPA